MKLKMYNLHNMQIGIMNNPFNNIRGEIEWIGRNGFSFVDFTLEPSESQPKDLNANVITQLLSKYKLGVIGHTCYYLPYAHTIQKVQDAAIEVFKEYIDFMSLIGATAINIHTDKHYPDEAKEQVLENHIAVLKKLCDYAEKKRMVLMFENTHSGLLSDLSDIETILASVPKLWLHLDIAHAYVAGVRDFQYILDKYKTRIQHIHVSDNDGSFDQHRPLGQGNIPWITIIPLIKLYLPETTITLEIFDSNTENQRNQQLVNRHQLEQMWFKD